MSDFKTEFFALLEKYKKDLPYMEEHLYLDKDEKHYYNVILEIEERTHQVEKPKFDDVESLIQYMLKNKDIRIPADNPNNSPQLVGFSGENEKGEEEYCAVSFRTAINSKMLSREILAEVQKREKDKKL